MADKQPYERYRYLAERWLKGTITPKEKQEYIDWYNDTDESPLLVHEEFVNGKEEHRKRLLTGLYQEMTPEVSMKTSILRITAAAAVLILLTTGGWYFYKKSASPTQDIAKEKPTGLDDVLPGVNGAILTLGSGKVIVLDTANNGMINNNIQKADGSIAFFDETTSETTTSTYNTLVTPKARQQQIVLSDGTRIWLNAASSITFPSSFTPGKREVVITGEAYFEVALDSRRPFIVKTGDAAIEVLGTAFNVMAYANERSLQTTLIEGSVKMKHATASAVVLKPGQQGSFMPAARSIHVIPDADVELAVSWKNGLQAFKKASIQEIMRQVERWYDVEVIYDGTINEVITFTGEIPRGVTLSQLLKIFETDKINFVINGAERKITVSEKRK